MKYLEKNNLNDLIENGTHLVDFYADWCGPCKMLHPVLESLDKIIDIIKINVDKFDDLANEYKVMSIPTIIFFKDGKMIKELVGFHSAEEFKEIIEKL
jgi:thioredoxin 1